jgi:hypothetical protein
MESALVKRGEAAGIIVHTGTVPTESTPSHSAVTYSLHGFVSRFLLRESGSEDTRVECRRATVPVRDLTIPAMAARDSNRVQSSRAL